MKRERAWLLCSWLCLGAGAGSGPTLTGRVFLDFQGSTLAAQVKLSLGGLNPTRTDDTGVFVLSLPPGSQPGARIKLDITKPGYCILSPFNGEVVVPDDKGQTRPLEVRLLRSDSKQSNSEDCIARFIDAVAQRPRIPTNPERKPEPFDLPKELQAWAGKQGVPLTTEQASEALRRWLGEVKSQPGRDAHTQGLARYAEKRFTEARALFLQAAQEEKKLAEDDTKRLEQRRERIAQNYRLAGNAAREELNFDEALQLYQMAEANLSRTAQPTEWATVQVLLGVTHDALGVRVSSERAVEHLAKAVAAYRLALTIFTRKQHPQDFARTQLDLGCSILAQGMRALRAESLLAESVAAYRLALEVFTPEQLPQYFAQTQLSLAIALKEQGRRATGAESRRLLAESVAACRLALTIFTREQLPTDFAATQLNLGIVLRQQALRATGLESLRLLSESVAAHRLALEVFTREQLPQDVALTQTHLGNALREQGVRATGAESLRLLAESVAAYRLALTIRTREQLPQPFAKTQTDLGNALREQGVRTSGAESLRLLDESVTAYRLALTVYTREHRANDFAATQTELGDALREQGVRAIGAESLRLLAESVTAYRLALIIYTREHSPDVYANTQADLGDALLEQGVRVTGSESLRLLSESVAAYRLALEVFTREQMPQHFVRTQTNMGVALEQQGLQASGSESLRLLSESVTAYRLALIVDPDALPTLTSGFQLCQERLFDYAQAYELLAGWLKRHPDDIDNQANFVEAHLTTRRFAESARRAATLLLRNDLAPSLVIGLLSLEILSRAALNQTNQLPPLMKSLRDTITAQPPDFHLTWSFVGVKAFLIKDVQVDAQRAWLLDLLSAVENKNRQVALAAIDALKQRLPTP